MKISTDAWRRNLETLFLITSENETIKLFLFLSNNILFKKGGNADCYGQWPLWYNFNKQLGLN